MSGNAGNEGPSLPSAAGFGTASPLHKRKHPARRRVLSWGVPAHLDETAEPFAFEGYPIADCDYKDCEVLANTVIQRRRRDIS
jgi:hypothetical protein